MIVEESLLVPGHVIHKSQDSDLDLDLSEEASGRLCPAHSCVDWGEAGFSRVCPGVVLGALTGRLVSLCVMTIVTESPECHRGHPSPRAHQSFALELGAWK